MRRQRFHLSLLASILSVSIFIANCLVYNAAEAVASNGESPGGVSSMDPSMTGKPYVVSTRTDSGPGSLRQAILDANGHPGKDIIVFALDPGSVITLSSELQIMDDVVIVGDRDANSATRDITISGGDSTRIFNIASYVSVTLNNLILSHGRAVGEKGPAGAAGKQGATLSYEDDDGGSGGAGGAGGRGSDGKGGGILNAGNLYLDYCTLSSNIAQGGPGGDGGVGGGGAAGLSDIYNRHDPVVWPGANGGNGGQGADGFGGAIYNSGSVNTNDTLFENNSALPGIGGNGGGGGGGGGGAPLGSSAPAENGHSGSGMTGGTGGKASDYGTNPYRNLGGDGGNGGNGGAGATAVQPVASGSSGSPGQSGIYSGFRYNYDGGTGGNGGNGGSLGGSSYPDVETSTGTFDTNYAGELSLHLRPRLIGMEDSGVPAADILIQNTNLTYSFTGSGEQGSTINLYLGSTFIGSTQPDNSGVWTFTSSSLIPEGSFFLTAVGTDRNRHINSISVVKSIEVDHTAPSAPANLNVTSSTDIRVNLTWRASTDNIGVTEYGVYRDGTQVGTTTTTAFSDNGVVKGTTYSYAVKAKDAAGNMSDPSNSTSVTVGVLLYGLLDRQGWTAAASSSYPQSEPDKTIDGKSSTYWKYNYDDYYPWISIDLGWVQMASRIQITSNYFSTSSYISLDYSPDGSNWSRNTLFPTNNSGTNVQSLTVDFPAKSVRYLYLRISLSNYSYNTSAISEINVYNLAPPTNLNASTITDTSVSFSWTTPVGTGLVGYDIYRGKDKIGSSTDTFYTDSNLMMGTAYSYTVRAKDSHGNTSLDSGSLNVKTKDTQAPSVPTNLTVSSKTDTTVTLAWTAATDNVGVTGYYVFRDAKVVATVTNKTYTDKGLTQGTNYSYTVSAFDAAGNESNPSPDVSVLTVDTEAPMSPANLKIIQTSDFTTLLKWDASTDNVGVAGYHIYSNLKKIATVTGTTSYTVSNANNGATSLYNVTAFDEAGNESPLSGNADHAPDGSGTITVSTGSVITDQLSTIVFRYTAPSGGLHNGSVSIDVPAGWTVPNAVYGSRGYATASTGVLSISGQTLTVTGITLPDGGEMTITYSDVTSPGTSGTYTFNAKSKMTVSGTLTGIAASPQVMVASDSTQPTWDANGVLSFSNLSTNGLTVSWPAASDQIGITKYEIWRNGYLLSTVTGNVYSYHDGGLSAGELYTYLLKAYDAAGNAADGPSTGVNTNTWMTINAGSIPSGTRGIPYKTSLSAAGGTSPYTWSVIGLPSGLTFDSSKGVIAGIPLSEGISSVTASVYDRLGQRIGLSFDITVNPPAMNIVSTSLATGTLGMPYQELLTASGGSSDYTWNVEGLPAGIILDTSTGKLSGVPSAAGTYLLNVSVSDRSSPGLHASHSLSLVINYQVLSITTTVLPIGITGTAYSAALATTGGTPLHVWNAAGLPAGLSINSATGVISGIPAAAGVYSVTVTLTDNNGSNANVGLSLLVNPASSTGKYTVTPQTDPSYTVGATADGIAVMTVNNGVSGFTYFTVNISPVEAHSGNETAVFVLIRNGVQLSINATEADFDSVNRGRAGFNVQVGDVVKSFLVDNLSNSPGFNPTLLK
ncbi:fibronectin type III domain-containing protein [Paenibacillus sp. V4I5]|uniref:fibronectin type III domain-containing protein n=1 Tax=Paenibacillus sp. V4I5 TaxID=3042306 RepID=UPI002790606F|nr:putative Ig domain-containing protein [Paenibacillus sp. V4I5]MDQ0917533.1 chitodextrinase [Paenibacillus sp. V4I5]